MAIWEIGIPFKAKKCPACGKKRSRPVLYNDTGTTHFWVGCTSCGRETKSDEESAYTAIEHWNNDVFDDPGDFVELEPY